MSSNRVYGVLNTPLCIFGVERSLAVALFAASLIVFVVLVNTVGTGTGICVALVSLVVLMVYGYWLTQRDPQMLRIMFDRRAQHAGLYDPAK